MTGSMAGSEFVFPTTVFGTMSAPVAELCPQAVPVTHEPRFYTGSITVWARVRPDGLTPVRITRAKPRFADDVDLAVPELMVPWRRLHMLAQNLSWDQFVAGERARLRQIGVAKIAKQLDRLYRQHGPLILLDWSTHGVPSGQSARRVFADWFEDQTGENIPEIVWHQAPVEPERQLVLV